MRDIKDIGEVIVIRELEFISDDGKKEKAFLKVGKPYELNKETYCCPYELSTESRKKTYSMIGIDSLQALSLTMKTFKVEIEYWERNQNGKFYFLNEEGAEVSF